MGQTKCFFFKLIFFLKWKLTKDRKIMNEVLRLAVFCHKMTNALNAGFDIQRALLVTMENETGSLAHAIERTPAFSPKLLR